MILVTLGTQDKGFPRLLEALEKAIENKSIKEKVIVQAGYTEFESKNMEIYKLLPMDKFDEYMKKCDLLITHAGVGSIMSGLELNKKIIATPRLEKYGEHTNNHQIEIAREFSKEGYIIYLEDFDKLGEIIKNIKNFKPRKYKSNNDNFIKIIENYIDNN